MVIVRRGSWTTLTQNIKTRRHATDQERELFELFVRLNISLETLISKLNGMMDLDFDGQERRFTSYFLLSEPGIKVEKEDIQFVLDRHWRGEISDREVSQWATMLLMNEVYDWAGQDEDEIAELLNELALRGPSSNQE